ncbi:MAG: GldG family protein [Deltaproteobacteria bacterium]|nr:GldG family protein [Deltaproteobacteria bacterium]
MKRYLSFTWILGLMLLAAGGFTFLIKGAMETFTVSILWAGLVLLLVSFYINFSDIKDLISKRSTKYGFNTAVMVGIFIAIIALTAVMSMKYKFRWDITKGQRYTLSDQTQKLLRSLKKDVTATAFYRSDERTKQQMEDLLEEYSHYSPRFKYQFIDPDKKPGLASKHGITSYRTTLIQSGDKQEIVGFESEEKLTNAILKATREKVKVVYFLKGHGENNITDFQNAGYKAVREAIEKENYQTKELLLLETPNVPEDANLIIISGPKKDILPEELKRIKNYIDAGGNVLFMLDPDTVPNTVSFLKDYGFNIGADIIIDKLSQVFGANYLTPVVGMYDKEHPITKDFNVATFFPVARSVGVEKDPSKGVYPLAMTGEQSWAETDRKALEAGTAEYNDGKDKRGPIPIAAVAAVEVKEQGQGLGVKGQGDEKKKFAKIVVFGDSDFVNNTQINLAGNKDLFLNTVNWLAEESDLISIRKKEANATPLLLTKAQGKIIFWLPVVIMPAIVLCAGIVILSRRKFRK